MMVFILKYLQCGLRYGKRKKAIFGGSAANVKTIEFVPRKKKLAREMVYQGLLVPALSILALPIFLEANNMIIFM